MNVSSLVAEDLLRSVGPGRFLLIGDDDQLRDQLLRKGSHVDRVLPDQAHRLPNPAVPYDTVVLDGRALLEIDDSRRLFRRLRTAVRRFIALAPGAWLGELRQHGVRAQAGSWAAALIDCGFRRSPAHFSAAHYVQLNSAELMQLDVYERIDDAVTREWPIERLLRERDLHMDMSREFGPRADAHLVRYALAADWVRPGDTVLDCACGLGYGSALLAAQSAGSRFIGVDIDDGAIAYALANFALTYSVDYRAASGSRLDFLPDASVDFIASFETIEHVEDYDALIDEFARVLKPDGRIIASVPHMWVDETGRDPNPHHFHAFDYDKFQAALARRFLVEARYRQEAPGGFKLWQAARALERRPLTSDEPDTEWWIVVASCNPHETRRASYRHPAFAISGATDSALTRFEAHYANPWLYRPLVQMGERLKDDGLLRELALSVLSTSTPDSPDFGAAATVLGYQMLAQNRSDLLDDLLELADQYTRASSTNPHTRRWQISLAYVCATLCLAADRRARAKQLFDAVAARDALEFSPLLATKTVAANFWRGILRLIDGDRSGARAAFSAGVSAAAAALRATGEDAIGNADAPLAFGFQELAEVADMASQCTTALLHLHEFDRSPGRFWKKIDTRRFGLASWCLHLERENDDLRQALARAAQSPAAQVEASDFALA